MKREEERERESERQLKRQGEMYGDSDMEWIWKVRARGKVRWRGRGI